jgi:hypothetical protein
MIKPGNLMTFASTTSYVGPERHLHARSARWLGRRQTGERPWRSPAPSGRLASQLGGGLLWICSGLLRGVQLYQKPGGALLLAGDGMLLVGDSPLLMSRCRGAILARGCRF